MRALPRIVWTIGVAVALAGTVCAIGIAAQGRHRHATATRAPERPVASHLPATPSGLRLARFTVQSRAVGGRFPELIVAPRSVNRHRGLIVFLHADRGDQESTLSAELFRALLRLGRDAPAILFIGGGRRSYWHDRSAAAWGRYVVHEVLPAALRRTGGDPHRVMVAGISMGAYGALDLARLHPGRFCAVAGHSPILWRRWRAAERAQPAGFDDRRDFERHNLLRAAKRTPRTFARQPIWLDAGRDDGLARPHTLTLARVLRKRGVPVRLHAHWAGGHNGAYWARHWDAYLRFDAAALGACRAAPSANPAIDGAPPGR